MDKDKLEEFRKLYLTAEDNLLMSKEWNDIEKIAEELDVYVTKNGKICLDIVEVQNLIGFVVDDLWDNLEKLLRGES